MKYEIPAHHFLLEQFYQDDSSGTDRLRYAVLQRGKAYSLIIAEAAEGNGVTHSLLGAAALFKERYESETVCCVHAPTSCDVDHNMLKTCSLLLVDAFDRCAQQELWLPLIRARMKAGKLTVVGSRDVYVDVLEQLSASPSGVLRLKWTMPSRRLLYKILAQHVNTHAESGKSVPEYLLFAMVSKSLSGVGEYLRWADDLLGQLHQDKTRLQRSTVLTEAVVNRSFKKYKTRISDNG